MSENNNKFTNTHKITLRRRGLDPKDYVLVKETYGTLWIRNIHTNVVKIINKCN